MGLPEISRVTWQVCKYSLSKVTILNVNCARETAFIFDTPVKLSWIFPGAPLKINGSPGNIQGDLTGMSIDKNNLEYGEWHVGVPFFVEWKWPCRCLHENTLDFLIHIIRCYTSHDKFPVENMKICIKSLTSSDILTCADMIFYTKWKTNE